MGSGSDLVEVISTVLQGRSPSTSCSQDLLFTGPPVHRTSCSQGLLFTGPPVHRTSWVHGSSHRAGGAARLVPSRRLVRVWAVLRIDSRARGSTPSALAPLVRTVAGGAHAHLQGRAPICRGRVPSLIPFVVAQACRCDGKSQGQARLTRHTRSHGPTH